MPVASHSFGDSCVQVEDLWKKGCTGTIKPFEDLRRCDPGRERPMRDGLASCPCKCGFVLALRDSCKATGWIVAQYFLAIHAV